MTLSKKRYLILLFPALVVLVSLACNMPLIQGPSTSPSDQIKTAAAETLAAQLTEISQATATGSFVGVPTLAPPTATTTNAPGNAPTATATNTPQVEATRQPSATPTPACNQIAFVKDVTIPDNTDFSPGATFTKTWRLKNSGICAWNPNYALVVDGKNTLNAPDAVLFTGTTIQPGETVDVSVDLRAPDLAGTYRTNFKLRSDGGEVFGIGNQNKPFWAQIDVVVAAGVTFDFNSRSKDAKWVSGTDDNVENDLTYGGATDDPNGTATVADGVKMENGGTSGKVLLTIPKRTDDGFIRGTYPDYLVQSGDRLKGRLGFAIPSGSCGSGKLRFEIQYKVGDKTSDLGEWNVTCDGKFTTIDIDLSSLKGQTIKFVLTVRSDGAFIENYAIWNSLGVQHP
jgi:hypothetical protein